MTASQRKSPRIDLAREKKPTSLLFFWLLIILGSTVFGCQPSDNRSTDEALKETAEAPEDNQPDPDAVTPAPGLDLSGTQYAWLVVTQDAAEYQSLNQSIFTGLADGVDWLNSEGRVFGAEIELTHVSIGPEGDGLIEQVLAAIDEVEPVVLFMAAPINETLYYELSQEDLPILYFGFGSSLNDITAQVGENIFWLVPPADEQFAFFLSEVWKHWNRLRPSGNINEVRLGYLSSDPTFPMFQSNPGLDKFLRQTSFEIVLREGLPATTNASVTNFLVDSISAGVTVLYADTFSPGTAVLINDLNALAISEFFVVGGGTWSIDPGIEDFLLEAGPVERYLTVLPMAWWSEQENPAIQLARSIRAENRRGETQLDAAYLLALGAADLGAEALGAAIERAGGARVTGEDVLEQMAVIENYDVLGGLYTLDYFAGKRTPTFLRVWQIQPDGELSPIGSGGEVPDFSDGPD